jgi:hypothetical protein
MYDPWTKAIDLQQWAPRNEARFTLPAVVRRLIWATTKGKREFSFPAGEGVQRPSWDGKLTVVQGNVWVPDNSSVWEMSTGDPPATKATENYAKRTAATPAMESALLTFVFVTPLKWTGKRDWADARKAEGSWKDVRVLDSDDLEHWLEAAPAVDIWLARVVGKTPAGVRDLSHHWDLVAALTKPSLPAAAFLAGRQTPREELSKALAAEAREIPVAASSEQELVDFVAAVYGSRGEDDAMPARLVLVESREAWNQITASTEPLVLLPAPGLAVDRTAIAQAVKAGHHVITRRPYSTQAEAGIIRLPRAWRHELSEALTAAGFAEDRAGRLARECGGYLAVLQRLAAPNAGTAVPAWAQDPDGALLAPFVLFGSWDDAKDADREVVAQLTGGTYDHALALASGWLVKPETPFRRNGTEWHIVSREDTWVHLAARLTRPMLDNFARVAVRVLSEDDPRFELDADQRAFAAIHGKLPRHSGELRAGLAETLALLGADLISLPALPPGTGPSYARKIIRELLPPGLTTHRWFTLSPILTLLAEAAPEEFLHAVERDVAATPAALVGLFAGDDGGIFSSSRHHHLMWALTSLAWHPDYLTRTALVLARLAALDPGGKTSPRPDSSLIDIFRPWFPQTGASAAQRFEVIDLLIEREPEQAWKLLSALLPKGHDAASGTYPPRWREWPAAKKPRVTWRERGEQWRWTGERLLKLALPVPARLLELTGDIDHLLEKEFQALVGHLSGLDPQALPVEERRALWNSLHELIRRHEFFNTAEWRMTDARLETLRKVEAHLRPEAPAERGRWLFAQHHLYMGTHRDTPHEKQEELALEQRRLLLTEIFADGGVRAVADFAAKLPYPGLVGDVLGSTGLCPDAAQVLPQYLDDPDPNVVVFGRCYAAAIFNQRDWAWVDMLPLNQWTANAAIQFLVVLPFVPRTWTLAQALGPDVENGYWSRARPFPRGLESTQAAHALGQLLQHNRPLEAADYIGLVYHNRLTVPAPLLAETLDKCVPGLNEAAAAGHDVSMLVHRLEDTLGFLQEAPDNDPTQVARLEWTYLPLLRHGHASPKFLHRELGRDPGFFAHCIELVWRKEGEETPAEMPEAMVAQATLAHSLLESWATHPALLAEGGPDETALRTWVEDARRRCEAIGRLKFCDHEIGQLLASSPAAPDGSWPCIAVRNVLESIPGEIALDAFHSGVFNGRGGTSRGMHQGGEQERQLAKKYHGFADACQMRWPRVAAALRRLARVYEADARFMDDQADDHA